MQDENRQIGGDDDLEQYLKAFRPRSIRALAVPGEGPMVGEGVTASRVTTQSQAAAASRAEDSWLRALTMAAMVVLAASFALWYGARQTAERPESAATQGARRGEMQPATRVSTVALTKLALDDSQAFDALLARESQTMFPGMQGNQSALRALGKP
jgi:hypothetical protein